MQYSYNITKQGHLGYSPGHTYMPTTTTSIAFNQLCSIFLHYFKYQLPSFLLHIKHICEQQMPHSYSTTEVYIFGYLLLQS